VVFTEPYFAHEYLKNNPGTIKNIAETNPIRFYDNCYMIKQNKSQLQHALDVTIKELINRGYVDKVREKYEPAPGLFFRDRNHFDHFYQHSLKKLNDID